MTTSNAIALGWPTVRPVSTCSAVIDHLVWRITSASPSQVNHQPSNFDRIKKSAFVCVRARSETRGKINQSPFEHTLANRTCHTRKVRTWDKTRQDKKTAPGGRERNRRTSLSHRQDLVAQNKMSPKVINRSSVHS